MFVLISSALTVCDPPKQQERVRFALLGVRSYHCSRRRRASSARRPRRHDRSAAAAAGRRQWLAPSRSRPRTTPPDSAAASPRLRQRRRSRRRHPLCRAAPLRLAAHLLRGCTSSAARGIRHTRLGSSSGALLCCTTPAEVSSPSDARVEMIMCNADPCDIISLQEGGRLFEMIDLAIPRRVCVDCRVSVEIIVGVMECA